MQKIQFTKINLRQKYCHVSIYTVFHYDVIQYVYRSKIKQNQPSHILTLQFHHRLLCCSKRILVASARQGRKTSPVRGPCRPVIRYWYNQVTLKLSGSLFPSVGQFGKFLFDLSTFFKHIINLQCLLYLTGFFFYLLGLQKLIPLGKCRQIFQSQRKHVCIHVYID